MYRWLDHDGRVAIFTRDLSWALPSDTELLGLMTRKSRAHELTIVIPNHTTLTQQLESDGADIVTYPNLNYIIQSRFTFSRLGRAGARVAIGHLDSDTHVIEIADASDPTFYLAGDLLEIMRRI